MQSTLYNDVVTEQSRSSLATELMVYHMQVRKTETERQGKRQTDTERQGKRQTDTDKDIYIYMCV